MARYIDADKLWNDRLQVTPEKSMDYKAGFSECMWAFSKLIREQIDNSTADVEPRSEEGAECPTCYGTGRIGTTDWLTKGLSKKQLAEEKAKAIEEHEQHIKQDVAKEIFEEIETLIKNNCLTITDERGIKGYVDSSVHFALAELKKKYTEGE